MREYTVTCEVYIDADDAKEASHETQALLDRFRREDDITNGTVLDSEPTEGLSDEEKRMHCDVPTTKRRARTDQGIYNGTAMPVGSAIPKCGRAILI